MLSFLTYLVQSGIPTVFPVVRLVSIAYGSTAESIMRRSLRTLEACERLRARKNPGTAIAASNAMIATTIMISTSVKPAFRRLNLFNMMFMRLLVRFRAASHGDLVTVAFAHNSFPATQPNTVADGRRMNREILYGP